MKLKIKSKPESFRRAGIVFTREGVIVDTAQLTDEQIDALENEPNLVVAEVDGNESDTTDQPPADEPPVDEPPADEPLADEPPADEPPADEPPAAAKKKKNKK